jgi:hypothetical protein
MSLDEKVMCNTDRIIGDRFLSGGLSGWTNDSQIEDRAIVSKEVKKTEIKQIDKNKLNTAKNNYLQTAKTDRVELRQRLLISGTKNVIRIPFTNLHRLISHALVTRQWDKREHKVHRNNTLEIKNTRVFSVNRPEKIKSIESETIYKHYMPSITEYKKPSDRIKNDVILGKSCKIYKAPSKYSM